jgi:hypothetical protein
MSAPVFAHPHFSELGSSLGVAAPAATTTQWTSAAESPNPAAASAAHEAVDAVLKLADAQAVHAATGVHAVTIGIKFGEGTLGVRVELRDGRVHTQFNTDSPELQVALAGEWSNLTKDNADRPYHFSDPVFASANGNAADLSSGSGGGASHPDSAPQFSLPRATFAAPASALTATAGSASAALPADAVPTARHLQTFA